MRAGLHALLCAVALGSSTARADPVIYWLDDELPAHDVLLRVEAETGSARHLLGLELAWPTVSSSPREVGYALDALGSNLIDCRDRWEAFDVERGIAWQLASAIDELDVLWQEEHRDLLSQALLLQGAALHWAYPPGALADPEGALPLIFQAAGQRHNGPWSEAWALDPERQRTRDEFPDQGSYEAFLVLVGQLERLNLGYLDARGLPAEALLVVDGRKLPEAGKLALAPGRHRVHLAWKGTVAGPGELRIEPGQTVVYEGQLALSDLQAARRSLLLGELEALPAALKSRVEQLRTAGDEDLHLAVRPSFGPPRIYAIEGQEPWSDKDPPVSLLLGAGLGLGAMRSSAFVESEPEQPFTAPSGALALSADLGIRRFLLHAGVELQGSLGGTVLYGDPSDRSNVATALLPRFSLGPGAYLIRPRPRCPHLLLALPVGVTLPGHVGVGLQAMHGLPVARGTWLRFGFELWASRDLPTFPEPNDPLLGMALRLGIAHRL